MSQGSSGIKDSNEILAYDCHVMDKYIWTIIAPDEAVALRCPGRHLRRSSVYRGRPSLLARMNRNHGPLIPFRRSDHTRRAGGIYPSRSRSRYTMKSEPVL